MTAPGTTAGRPWSPPPTRGRTLRTRRSAPAAPSRVTTTGASTSGATVRACSPWAAPSRPPWIWLPMRLSSSTSRARAATATMPPTTSPWTPRCSRRGFLAGTCGCSGAAPTKCPGNPSARPWSPTSPPASTSTGRSPTGHMSCGATATRPGPAMRRATACWPTPIAPASRCSLRRSTRLPSAVTARQRNAEPYYDIARVDVTIHRLLTMPIRTSSLRSLGSQPQHVRRGVRHRRAGTGDRTRPAGDAARAPVRPSSRARC